MTISMDGIKWLLGYVITLISFILVQKRYIQNDEYQRGIRDQKIDSKFEAIMKALDNLPKDYVSREEFVELTARCKSNTHRLNKIDGGDKGD